MTIQYGEDYDVHIPKVAYLVVSHNIIISHMLHQPGEGDHAFSTAKNNFTEP